MFLVVVLGCGIAVFVARSVFAMQDVGFSDLMRGDFYQSVSVIGMLLVYVSQSNALFWLVTYKLGIEIQHQALTDVLTNAGNRRALDELMERAVPVGEDSSIGIMMIDVDGALYDAKSKGRNKVGVEPDTHSTGLPGENDLTIA